MNILQVITGRGPTGPAATALIDAKALIAAGATRLGASAGVKIMKELSGAPA